MTTISPIPINQTTVVDPVGNIIVDPNIPDNVTPLDVDLLRFKPNLPPIDYTNLDFSSIKLQLLNLLRANTAKLGYSVRDFADSNTAGMMMNLMAYMGQMLSYHMDSMVNELFLDTAQSSYSTFRLLNMFKYKPTRPQQGVVMLTVTRQPSTNTDLTAAAIEDASEIVFSSSLSRQSISFGGENFEIFPALLVDGMTEWCGENCYAERAEIQYPAVLPSYVRNLEASRLSNFARMTTMEIQALPKSYNLFRIHVAGEFYSVQYIKSWIAIVKANPQMAFYSYTRSWRVPHLVPYLKKLASLANMSLLCSTDIDTFNAGESVPQGMREAYAGDIQPDKSVLCLVQSKKSPSCEACKLCTKPGLKSKIYFSTH